MRLNYETKEKAARASALLGYSMTEYVSRIIEKDASAVIREFESFEVSGDCFERFDAACRSAGQPNEALERAVRKAEELGIS